MKHLIPAAVAAIAIALAASATAADKKDEKKDKSEETAAHTLSEFKIGDLITGPEVKLDEIKGKAVVIENWGVNCPPCIASLPHMEKLAKRHKDKLVLIGAHSQDATDDQVKAVVKKFRLSYSIVKGSNGPLSSGTIPHAYVFDSEGKLVFHGLPSDREFDKAVRKALPKS
jgi:thiol-disulfide isomerase/thioredoxin